jgi:hypothetical protein
MYLIVFIGFFSFRIAFHLGSLFYKFFYVFINFFMFLASQIGIGKSIWQVRLASQFGKSDWHWQVNLASQFGKSDWQVNLASQIGKSDWQVKLPFLYCFLLYEVHPFLLFPRLSSIALL